MKFIRRLILIAAILVAPSLCFGQTSQPASAKAVIEQVMHDVLGILRDPALSKADKTKKVRAIADERIDFATLARLTMATHWRELNATQQTEFVKQFTEHVSITHGNIIDEYNDEQVQVTGDRAEARGDYTVTTHIIGKKPDGNGTEDVARVDYRLRQNSGRWMIIDVTIDGVSLAANFRAQFQEILSNGGIDQLLKLLREKNLENETAANK
jgi:phospholipid transport system substrate-binding protein